jgi:hypothetical protein
MSTELLVLAVSGVFAVLWYLLRQKDAKQGQEIAEIRKMHKDDVEILYKLHHKDVDRLTAFELEIAKNHYPKNDLDRRFEQLDKSIKDGFTELGGDIKEMTKALHDHLKDHHTGGTQ